jgi:hypothetical protein
MATGSSRRLPLFAGTLALLACLALARPAQAQTTGTAGTTGTTGTLAQTDFFIGIQQQEGSNLAAFDLARFFNKANCDCETPVFLYFTLTSTGIAKRSTTPTGTVKFFVGQQCDQILLQPNCTLVGSDRIEVFMQHGRETLMTTAKVMSTSTTTSLTADGGVVLAQDCMSTTNGFTQTVWAVFDYGADGVVDFSATQAVTIDLTPPPAPTNITVAPGNEAVTVSWTPVDYSLNMDLQGYQILCERGDNTQVFANGTFTPYIKSCKATAGVGVVGLDPLFVCSPLLNRSDSSYRVKILQNDIYYAAAVVAIDISGNAAAPVLVGCDPNVAVDPVCSWQKPQKTDSFFDVYRDGNSTNGGAGQMATPGAATGGFCAVAGDGHRGRWGLGIGCFAVVAALLARARRRRRR